MSPKKELSQKNKSLIKDLESDDIKVILKALEEIGENGNSALIQPMIDLGVRRDEKEIRDALQTILFGIKISSAHPIMLDALVEMKANSFRQILLSMIWTANINGLDHLDTFVRIAIEGTLYEAIECLTVIEESEGELNEEKILESLLLLNEYMKKPGVENDAKFSIIESIFIKVSDLNKGIQ